MTKRQPAPTAGDTAAPTPAPTSATQQPDPLGRAILELANLQSSIHRQLWRAEEAGRYVPLGDYPHGTPYWTMVVTDILNQITPRLAALRRGDQ